MENKGLIWVHAIFLPFFTIGLGAALRVLDIKLLGIDLPEIALNPAMAWIIFVMTTIYGVFNIVYYGFKYWYKITLWVMEIRKKKKEEET